MTVYIVVHSDDYTENTIVEGIFSTEEKAKEAITLYKIRHDYPDAECWNIFTRELDKVQL